MNNGEKTCHHVKSYKICSGVSAATESNGNSDLRELPSGVKCNTTSSSFNTKSTENTVKDTRFTQISTIFNPSHCPTSRKLNIEIALVLENQRKESLVLRKHIFGNFSRMTYVSESESRFESSQNRDTLKTQKLIHNIPLLPIGLFSAIFNISKKVGRNKEFKFSQFDTFNFVICVRVSCCDKFSAYTTESKQNIEILYLHRKYH